MANLPQRYRPFLAQAQTEGALRYGAQESALGQLRSQAVHDYAQGLMAQTTATQGLLGSLTLAPQQITNGYASVGLTSPLLASLAQSGSPTAQRIAGEQASALAGIVQQKVGAQAGQVAGVNRLTDQYNQDAGQIGSQSTALEREKGLFEQDLVDQLITGDRAQRAAAKAELAKEQFTARQNTQSQDAETTRSIASALIGQGVTPQIDQHGNVTIGPPIPGSKSQQAKTPKLATGHQQSVAQTAFGHSLSAAQQMAQGGTSVDDITAALASGRPARPAVPARPVYVTIKSPGKPDRQQHKLNPDGTPMMRGGSPAHAGTPGIDQPIAQAVAEQSVNGYVSNATITKLHHLGYRVLDFPGLVTERQARARGTGGYSPPGSSVNPYAPGSSTNVR